MSARQADAKRLAITRQVIYALVAFAVIVPYLLPVPLPTTPSYQSQKLYDKINSLPPGSHVLLSFDYDPASKAELYPMSVSLLLHCFEKDLIPLIMTHWPDGVGMCRQALAESVEKSQKTQGIELVSGEDYVLLGFKPGGPSLLLNMGESFKGAYPKDYNDQLTEEMPAMEGVDTLRDIDMAVDLAAGPSVDMWVAYGSDRYNFPLGVGATAVITPDLYPFLSSGQLVALLNGLRGAADYEELIGYKEQFDRSGDGTRGMRPQSATQLLLILLILGANVKFIINRIRGKEGN